MMQCLKKMYRDELLHLALLLSLLRVDPDSYLGLHVHPVRVGLTGPYNTTWTHLPSTRATFVHPKNLDSILLNYERDVFADLNSLGRYNRPNHQQFETYLLNIEEASTGGVEDAVIPGSSSANVERRPADENVVPGPSYLPDGLTDDIPLPGELTQEDMDLIEVLWKQDVDLGFSLDLFKNSNSKESSTVADCCGDDIEKLKALQSLNDSPQNIKEEDAGCKEEDSDASIDNTIDPWAGIPYTIDLETGEYVIKPVDDEDVVSPGVAEAATKAPSPCPPSRASTSSCGDDVEEPRQLLTTDTGETDAVDLIDLPSEFSLEEALQLVGLDEDVVKGLNSSEPSSVEGAASTSPPPVDDPTDADDEDELETLTNMIQTAQFHHPHAPRPFQGRIAYSRTMSMEQRWQDLASLLSLSGEQHHHHHHHHHQSAAAAAAAAAAYAASSPTPASNATGYAPTTPYAHPHHTHPAEPPRGVLLHNATLAPPVGDLNATGPYPTPSALSGANLGNAVATSMNLTNSSEPMSEGAASAYKLEPSHELMFYPNGTNELNQTTDGFFSSILNDEDLQLVEMMGDSMYPMRMLDTNSSNNASVPTTATSGSVPGATTNPGTGDERCLDASSDSAVSSMGSERVPSLSDGEWMETGSDSGHPPGDHYGPLDYHHSGGKYRPYDYSYSGRHHSAAGTDPSGHNRLPLLAQKKHHMFGKRYFQDHGHAGASSLGSHGPSASLPAGPPTIKYEYSGGEVAYGGGPAEGAIGPKTSPELKYSCTMEFMRHHPSDVRPSIDHVQHNHSYHLPPESAGVMQRPVARDKPMKGRRGPSTPDHEHLNRDEKRARAMSIPMTVSDIINLPMDEFNERLSKYDLSEAQLSLIRDIRRRGKNKVAAQNCRKRKLDQILSLADEVKEMRDRKNQLHRERDYMLSERQRVKDKCSQLYRHVFQALRDPDGNPYSSYEYSLQLSADGSVVLVPRSNATSTATSTLDGPSSMGGQNDNTQTQPPHHTQSQHSKHKDHRPPLKE